MSEQTAQGEARAVLSKLHEAMNSHNLDAFLTCFEGDYQSEQPVHPDRTFRGRTQVEKNWSSIFAGIPDFHAELLRSAEDGEAIWAELHWTGTRTNGEAVDLRGVTIFGVRKASLTWGRLYMEPVDQRDSGIDAAVRAMASGGTSQKTGS